jgi:hypothetical protein
MLGAGKGELGLNWSLRRADAGFECAEQSTGALEWHRGCEVEDGEEWDAGTSSFRGVGDA